MSVNDESDSMSEDSDIVSVNDESDSTNEDSDINA